LTISFQLEAAAEEVMETIPAAKEEALAEAAALAAQGDAAALRDKETAAAAQTATLSTRLRTKVVEAAARVLRALEEPLAETPAREFLPPLLGRR
jgi:acyl-CoA reductase-like NAD-dependent aldehyde dehydrogenase